MVGWLDGFIDFKLIACVSNVLYLVLCVGVSNCFGCLDRVPASHDGLMID